MKITFRQLDVFKTMVATGTVTETAVMLGISQPAVSRLLADLQQEIGFKLFIRSGRNLKPTPEARLLVEEVRLALTGLEQIKHAAREIRQFRHARLRLVTTPFFSESVIPGLLKTFSRIHPDVMVCLEIQTADDSVEWLVSQTFDFGITQLNSNPAFHSYPLVERDACCIVPEQHPLANKKVIRPGDLDGQQFISYLPDSIFRFEIDEVFRRAKVKRNLQYEARTTAAIYQLVAAGLGISIVGHVYSDSIGQTGIRAIRFDAGISYKASLIWSKQRPMTLVARAFLDMISSSD